MTAPAAVALERPRKPVDKIRDLRECPERTIPILVDSREKCPLEFPTFRTRVETLRAGDYGLPGLSTPDRPRFAVERKSLPDLIQSLTAGRMRFWRELERLKGYGFAAVIIEGTEAQVRAGEYRSSASPTAMLASIAAIRTRHNVHVIFCESAQGAALELEGMVRQYLRGMAKDLDVLLREAHVG